MTHLRFIFYCFLALLPLQGHSLMPEPLYRKLSQLQIPLSQQLLIANIATQKLMLYEWGQPIKEYPISTAAKGVGNRNGSFQTPLGLHQISEKIGSNAPQFTVFESRIPTGQIWRPGEAENEDLILTRILRLKGIEPGVNKGRNPQGIVIDSHERYIYIHGTNHEKCLGTPSSKGCIRMNNRDIIDLFCRVQRGSLLWITER